MANALFPVRFSPRLLLHVVIGFGGAGHGAAHLRHLQVHRHSRKCLDRVVPRVFIVATLDLALELHLSFGVSRNLRSSVRSVEGSATEPPQTVDDLRLVGG